MDTFNICIKNNQLSTHAFNQLVGEIESALERVKKEWLNEHAFIIESDLKWDNT